jgi:hypothetical protein
MIDPAWIFIGLALPGMIAQAFYVTYCWPLKSPRVGRTAAAWAIGPGAAFVVGCQAVGGLSAGTAEHRLLMFLLPAVVLIAVAGAFAWIRGLKLDVARLLFALAAPATLLLVKYTGEMPDWSVGVAAAWLVGLSLWMIASWGLVARLPAEQNGRLNSFVVGFTAAAAAVVMMLSGSMKYGLMTATLAFSAGTIWAASWLARPPEATRGYEAAITPVLLCMLILAHFFAELSLVHMLLLGLAPTLLWVQHLGALKARRTTGLIVSGGLALVPVVFVLVQAGMAFAQKQSESQDW